MKAPMIAAMIALTTAAHADDATLATESMDAYKASLVEMARPLGEDAGRDLLLQIILLAGSTEGVSGRDIVAAFKDDPDRFLAAIRPYDGWTAEQIMAAKP